MTECPDNTRPPSKGTHPCAAKAGDLSNYAPWAHLAIIYRDFASAPGLFSLGRIDTPLGSLPEIADGTSVTIAAARQEGAPSPVDPA